MLVHEAYKLLNFFKVAGNDLRVSCKTCFLDEWSLKFN